MDYSDLTFEDKFDMAIREKAMEVRYNQGINEGRAEGFEECLDWVIKSLLVRMSPEEVSVNVGLPLSRVLKVFGSE